MEITIIHITWINLIRAISCSKKFGTYLNVKLINF